MSYCFYFLVALTVFLLNMKQSGDGKIISNEKGVIGVCDRELLSSSYGDKKQILFYDYFKLL